MKTRVKHRIVIVLALIFSILYFSNDFALIDIEKTAIIVAMGIDKAEEGVEITAQIGVPQATDQALDNDDTLINAKGKTVMDAIEILSKRSGWFPKLSFCNVIIFGKDLANDDISVIVDHLLASEHFQNSALLAVCDGPAKDFLSTPTPLDSISSFAIQKVLLENGAASSSVLDANIKDFAESTHGRNKCGYMPYITIISGDAKGQDSSSSATTKFEIDEDNRPIDGLLEVLPLEGSGGGGSSGGSGGGESKSPTAIFDASKTAVFKDGKICDILTDKETIAFNLLNLPADRVILTAEADGKTSALEVFHSTHKVWLDYGVKPTLNMKMKITVRIADGTSEKGEENSLGRRATVPQEFLDALEKDLTKTLQGLATRVLSSETDLFGIRNLTYKFHHKSYEDYKKIPLSVYEIKTDIQVFSRDKTGGSF